MSFGDDAWTRFFELANRGGRALERLGVSGGRLDDGELLDAARHETGLDDFGDDRFREGFEVLLSACHGEAALSPLGRKVTEADCLRLLTNRLRLREDRKRHPGIAEERIEAPLVILGLPRCGTTFLHGLLARDPANRVPRTWEVMRPSPPPPANPTEDHPRVTEAGEKLTWFGRLAPEYRKIHRTGACHPQECIAILSHSFESVRFHRTHHVPSYWRWLMGRNLAGAYAEHRRFLQQLQFGRRLGAGEAGGGEADAGEASGRGGPGREVPGSRWVLKTPSHLFFLDALLETYPDARIVQTHREPLTALASNASQIEVLRRAFSDRVVRPDADRAVRDWSRALDRATRLRERIGEERFVDLYYREIASDPIGAVRKIYERFGYPLSEETEAAMRVEVEAEPKGKHGEHRYSPEQYGFERERHGSAFADYLDRQRLEVT